MKIEREIPKRVKPNGKLSGEAVDLINEILFDPPDEFHPRCKSVMIFGSSLAENHQLIADTFRSVHEKLKPEAVFITGGSLGKDLPTESERILDIIGKKHFPNVDFRLDRKSLNTQQNVEQAIELGLSHFDSVCFIAKAPHCGRCRLTLGKYRPALKISHQGYQPVVEVGGPPFERHNWHQNERHIELVWGELRRIEVYGDRGDIFFPKELRSKIQRIYRLVGR
jgi:hypothetical protein